MISAARPLGTSRSPRTRGRCRRAAAPGRRGRPPIHSSRDRRRAAEAAPQQQQAEHDQPGGDESRAAGEQRRHRLDDNPDGEVGRAPDEVDDHQGRPDLPFRCVTGPGAPVASNSVVLDAGRYPVEPRVRSHGSVVSSVASSDGRAAPHGSSYDLSQPVVGRDRTIEHPSFVATLTRRGVPTSVTEPDRRWGAVRL